MINSVIFYDKSSFKMHLELIGVIKSIISKIKSFHIFLSLRDQTIFSKLLMLLLIKLWFNLLFCGHKIFLCIQISSRFSKVCMKEKLILSILKFDLKNYLRFLKSYHLSNHLFKYINLIHQNFSKTKFTNHFITSNKDI